MKRRPQMFAAVPLAAGLLLAGCTVTGRPPAAGDAGPLTSADTMSFSAHDVVRWAHLDDQLGAHPDQIRCGEADGRAILADYVTVWNGREMVAFVRAHGYRSFRGPLSCRRNGAQLEVEVEITGRDGATLILALLADGGLQGIG